MTIRHWFLLAAGITPVIVASSQQATPKCEDVFKDIQSFKGLPASELIPAMEFMSASLHYECSDCHDPKDYAASTRTKETARHMIALQRDINERHFGGRNEVTCNTCHAGKERPSGTPLPPDMSMRFERITDGPSGADLVTKYTKAAGSLSTNLVREGNLTAPNDVTHKSETNAVKMTQAPGSKFVIDAGARKIGSDGMNTWYGPAAMNDEPAHIFNRIGRAWTPQDFQGLVFQGQAGKSKIGKSETFVVRGRRELTNSTEQLYFDAKNGLLLRVVNVRPSTLGNVVMVIDYQNYKQVGSMKVPMKVVVNFAGGEAVWTLDFKKVKTVPTVDDKIFKG